MVSTPWGKIGLAICYDINYPNLFRQYALAGADAVIIPSCIRKQRSEKWNLLINARAYENQLYMLSCNYIGLNPTVKNNEDVMANDFSELGGMSSIIAPYGETVIEGSNKKEDILIANIDLSESRIARTKYLSLKVEDKILPIRRFS